MDLQKISGNPTMDLDENTENFEEATNKDQMTKVLRKQLDLLEWMDKQSGNILIIESIFFNF